MSREALEEFQRGLAMLSPARVEEIYREAWDRCRVTHGTLPPPEAVQQLVQAWKTLWRWRSR